MSYIVTAKAKKDLDDIWYHIAKDKITAANKVEDDFLKAFDLIAAAPYMGTQRYDLLDMSVRFWIVHSYYIIYDPETNPLQILRVISSSRDIKSHFKY